ncbi:MAG: hypothetical protein ACSLFM_09230 [Tepidiformaceae bacterium]
MAGFYAFTPTNGGSPTVDTHIYGEYVARGGLNYGSTKKLSTANFTPCGTTQSYWVIGCTAGSSSGISQTFEGPTGIQRALLRKSGDPNVYSVEGPVLYAHHFTYAILRMPTGNRSGTTQYFENGRVVVTSSPCQTVVYRNPSIWVTTYSGVC